MGCLLLYRLQYINCEIQPLRSSTIGLLVSNICICVLTKHLSLSPIGSTLNIAVMQLILFLCVYNYIFLTCLTHLNIFSRYSQYLCFNPVLLLSEENLLQIVTKVKYLLLKIIDLFQFQQIFFYLLQHIQNTICYAIKLPLL